MVKKHERGVFLFQVMFESCVVLDGDKTITEMDHTDNMFESCVVLDGDKT